MSSINEYIKSWYQLDKLISQKSKDLQVLKEKKSNLDTQISRNYLLQNKLTNNAQINRKSKNTIHREENKRIFQSILY